MADDDVLADAGWLALFSGIEECRFPRWIEVVPADGEAEFFCGRGDGLFDPQVVGGGGLVDELEAGVASGANVEMGG